MPVLIECCPRNPAPQQQARAGGGVIFALRLALERM